MRDILAKSASVQALAPDELAALIHVTDPDLWAEMRAAASAIKRKVYDNRIVTFAPLYIGNRCVNNCLYCGLRCDNDDMQRSALTMDQLRAECEVLAGAIGHKRLIIVFGEHPSTGIDYMVECMRTIYSVKVKARAGWGQIRRVNVNGPPMRIDELRALNEAGLGTYQVFQETYHPGVYTHVHPAGFKSNYAWRLYAMHRAMAAGIDDVGIGALFGLADWRFELMGLLAHAIELERVFNIGPHTISFPRMEPAGNAPYVQESRWAVSDEDIEKIVVLIRLAVPYTGMILTARENAEMRRRLIPLGVTQTDASLRIGAEGKFCKLNAVLTYREWLDDFASPETLAAAEPVLAREMEEVREQMPRAWPEFSASYERTARGERDLYF